MALWIALVAAFIVQEPISSNAVLLTAYERHYDIWLIHLAFVGATSFDMMLGYALGTLLKRRVGSHRIAAGLVRKFHALFDFSRPRSRRSVLFLYGPMIFPVSALLAPLFGVSLLETCLWIGSGNLILWYGVEWLIVLGVASFVPDPLLALDAAIIVSGGLALLGRAIIQRRDSSKPPDASC